MSKRQAHPNAFREQQAELDGARRIDGVTSAEQFWLRQLRRENGQLAHRRHSACGNRSPMRYENRLCRNTLNHGSHQYLLPVHLTR